MRCAECENCGLYKRNVSLLATRKATIEASRARAKQFVVDALKEFKVGRKDLCVSRFPEHTKLRRKLIRRMNAAGIGSKIISQAMEMNQSTIRYWLNPEYRAARLARKKKVCHPIAAHQSTSLALNG